MARPPRPTLSPMIARLLVLAFASSVPAATQACEGPSAGIAADPRAAASDGLRSIELQRLDGSSATLGELLPGFARGEVVVLCATEVGCPIAGKLAPRLERLA